MSSSLHRFALLGSLLAGLCAAAQVPQKLGYQGKLLKLDGTPENGSVSMTFTLFDAASGGTNLWSETRSVTVVNGFFAVFLGDQTTLPYSVMSGAERHLEISVGGSALTPRQRVTSVAYAYKARDADTVGGRSVVNNITVSADGGLANLGTPNDPILGLLTTCSTGQLLKWNGSAWACANDTDTDTVGVTSVTATAPVVSSGGSTPNISMPPASNTVDGYLSSADWITFNNKVSSNDPRLTDPRPPAGGSNLYIQNQSSADQVASFRITGTGLVGGNFTVGNGSAASFSIDDATAGTSPAVTQAALSAVFGGPTSNADAFHTHAALDPFDDWVLVAVANSTVLGTPTGVLAATAAATTYTVPVGRQVLIASVPSQLSEVTVATTDNVGVLETVSNANSNNDFGVQILNSAGINPAWNGVRVDGRRLSGVAAQLSGVLLSSTTCPVRIRGDGAIVLDDNLITNDCAVYVFERGP
jgi:hypothetical protein